MTPRKILPLTKKKCEFCGTSFITKFKLKRFCERACKTKAHDMRVGRKIYLNYKEYNNILKKQKNLCGICKEKPKTKKFAVDHCHYTNKIRGLLCTRCNLGIGCFQDNCENLKKAIAYLELYK